MQEPIFVPKDKGVGETFNWNNPLSWVIFFGSLLLIYLWRRRAINESFFLLIAYIKNLFAK